MQKYTASVLTAGCLWGLMGLFTRTLATYGVDSTGAIVLRCGIAALLPIDCLSVSRIASPADRVQVGQQLLCAIKNIDTVMGGTMIDYVIANISETRIMDVYEHNAPKKQERDDKPEYEEEK